MSTTALLDEMRIVQRSERSVQTLGSRTGTRIRLLGRSAPPPPAASRGDRRRADRLAPDDTQWADSGRLRTGHEVRVVDISTRGMLIHSPVRLPVGARIEVCLTESGTSAQLVVAGVARRCHVATLDPVTYTGALEFEAEIELKALQPFLSPVACEA